MSDLVEYCSAPCCRGLAPWGFHSRAAFPMSAFCIHRKLKIFWLAQISNQAVTNPGHQTTARTSCFTTALNSCGPSLWNSIHVTLVAPRILRRLEDFGSICKGTTIPLQPCTGPEISRSFEAPRFHDIRHMKVKRLSARSNGRLYSQEIYLVLISVGDRGSTVAKVLCYWWGPR